MVIELTKRKTQTRYSGADQNTLCIYWFYIKLQNVIINRIQRGAYNWCLQRGGGGRGELIFGDILIIACIFCLHVDGSITGGLVSGGGGRGRGL